ncbi:unnamed protein product [Cuscuta campestris]|uniref:Uncharacterized protein n=1 Tax=Cuscuta campestris TaxID=132261 RepID=A0A484M6E8_9ASTE|nr:unnamed protein product [Cuscuta campestris]
MLRNRFSRLQLETNKPLNQRGLVMSSLSLIKTLQFSPQLKWLSLLGYMIEYANINPLSDSSQGLSFQFFPFSIRHLLWFSGYVILLGFIHINWVKQIFTI